MVIRGPDGYFHDLNGRWTETLGWSLDELRSQPFIEFVHPDDRERTLRQATIVEATGSLQADFANRYLCKNGGYRWFSWSACRIGDDGSIFGIARDETDQRELLEELSARERRITQLLHDANTIREHERERIAGEIHDFALQNVIAADMAVERALYADDPTTAGGACERARELLARSIASIRGVLRGLVPVQLEQQSLDAALRSQATLISCAFDVPVHVELSAPDDLPPALRRAAFRAAAELLTNAAKHAAAGRIDLWVGVVDDLLTVRVCDDGVGMPATTDVDQLGMGLALTQETIRSAGGELRVDSQPGSGTRIEFVLPLELASTSASDERPPTRR